MTKHWYLAVCICTALHAGIEIDNRSSYPFRITSLTYEHNDGLHKMPTIEFTADPVAAHSRISLPAGGRRESILQITGTHYGKTYAFSLSKGAQGVLMITPDNQIKLLGPMFLEEKNGIHISMPEGYRGIRRL